MVAELVAATIIRSSLERGTYSCRDLDLAGASIPQLWVWRVRNGNSIRIIQALSATEATEIHERSTALGSRFLQESIVRSVEHCRRLLKRHGCFGIDSGGELCFRQIPNRAPAPRVAGHIGAPNGF
jgi:hypothetical protein